MYILKYTILILTIGIFNINCIGSIGSENVVCRGINGQKVPWFIIYKLPINNVSSDPLLRNATKYAYLLPGKTKWIIPGHQGIDNVNSLFGQTVKPIFKNPGSVGYIMYSSMPPNRPILRDSWSTRSHANGMVITDSKHTTGVWLTYSSPLFPQPISKEMDLESFMNSSFANDHGYSVQKSNKSRNDYENAQLILCLTLKYPALTISKIGDWLFRVHAYVFDYKNINREFSEYGWKNILKMQQDNTTSFWNSTKVEKCFNPLETHFLEGNKNIVVFVKKPECHYEIFNEYLRSVFHTDFLVQSWTLNESYMEPNCSSQYKIVNVKSKVINGLFSIGPNDHSKWGISTSPKVPVFCISDLNRRVQNKELGGLVICILDNNLRHAFLNIIDSIEVC